MMVKEHKFINAFRALAAFWVLAAHCMIWSGWTGISLPSPKIAVDLFMLISGYLMAANAFRKKEEEPLTNFRNQLRFWLRRFFRIAPAYYLSLFAAIVFGGHFLGGYQELRDLSPERWVELPSSYIYDPTRIKYSLKNIILHITFLFGLHPTWSFSTFLPDWSLSLEMQFYIVFPMMMLFLQKRDFVISSTAVGVISFILGVAVIKLFEYYEPSLLIFKLNYFIAGILSIYIINSDVRSKKLRSIVICVFILASLDFRYRWGWPVLPILLFFFLHVGRLENLSKTPSWIFVILNSKITRFASDTSFGVYLFHGFFISASGLILANYGDRLSFSEVERVLFMFMFVAICSYLAAYAVLRSVELPGIALGRIFIQRFAPLKQKPYLNAFEKPMQ